MVPAVEKMTMATSAMIFTGNVTLFNTEEPQLVL
jgi:hypothetical protein